MGGKRGSDWNKILKSLPLHDACPLGFLTMKDFAERAGASGPSILKAVRSGKIARQHCASLKRKNSINLIIEWNAAGYNFIAVRKEQWWPKDFKLNDEHLYKPFDTGEEGEEEFDDALDVGTDKVVKRRVTDIASAKFRVEQLKIERLEAELKLANNEVIPIVEVIAHELELALEIKASIVKVENKMAPLLAQANTVLECRSILEKHHREAFEALKPLEEKTAGA